jgi:uncharacterized protein YxjI
MYLIRERFFALGQDSDITDEHGRPVLHVDGKVLSLRNRLVLRDPEGREVAQVQRKLVAMRPTYQVSIGGQEAAEVRKRLFTPFGDRFTIDVPGPDDLEMTGDLFDHEFTIRRGDQTVATVSKRWFSMRDTYAVDVAADQNDLLILASVLALDLAEDQERKQTEPDLPASWERHSWPATTVRVGGRWRGSWRARRRRRQGLRRRTGRCPPIGVPTRRRPSTPSIPTHWPGTVDNQVRVHVDGAAYFPPAVPAALGALRP